MSLRCSLLGHTYGEAEIEREREEQGSEVVVTVREFEECARCGNRNVVSENKEVTAIETPGRERGESAGEDAGAGGASAEAGGATAGGAGATVGSAGADDRGSARAASPGMENDFEQPRSAEEDDGVILDDDGDDASDDPGREPGEWPDADSTHPAEVEGESAPSEWPDVGTEDEGFDARPGSGGDADVEFGGGLTPESAPEVDEEDDEVEFVNADGDTLRASEGGASAGGADLSAGFTSSGSVPAPDGPADDHDVDAEFVCPECGHREGVAGSSLRAGDICPECRRGYLAQE
ncbi:oxidoreductase [Halorussus salilacus]|uniref:DUF7093 family protein n=1 Tax=Halorussus salilacus TaxID=2953750 RepID=UPI0020A1E58E|nr:oxidoreductase [Halorussus salilacus]USZ69354.1 oxidoreductase [Halorussus salilacus]